MRDAIIRIGADAGAHLDGTLVTARTKLLRFGQKVAPELRRALHGAFSGLADVGGFAGVAGLGAAVKQVMEFEKRMTRLRIASRSSADDMSRLRVQLHQIAMAKGVQASDLLGGVEKFVEATGDIGSARDALDGFATVAAATGANMDDIGKAAAALSINMKINGPQMQQALAVMAMQGKAGAVELKNFAGILPQLTPQFSQFQKKGMEGLVELGAVAQVMKSGFASAEETATGFSGLMTALVKRADQLKAIGVNVFEVKDGKKQLRDFVDITTELIEKSKGDPQVLQKVLGRQEAYQALLPLMSAGAAGIKKLVDEGGNFNEILQDAETYGNSVGGRMEKLKAVLSQTFSAALTDQLGKVVQLFQTLVGAIKYLVEHPLLALTGWAALKVGPGGLPGLFSRMAGGGAASGAAGALGAAAQTVGGAVRVFVVNMGPGGMGADAAAGAGAAGASRRSRAARIADAAKTGAGLLAGIGSVWGSVTEGQDVTGGNVGAGILGGLLLGGPQGAAIAGAVAGGGYVGQKIFAEELSGGSMSRSKAARYGAFDEDAVLQGLFPGATVAEGRAGRDIAASYGAGTEQGDRVNSELAKAARVREVIDQALAPLQAAQAAAMRTAMTGMTFKLSVDPSAANSFVAMVEAAPAQRRR